MSLKDWWNKYATKVTCLNTLLDGSGIADRNKSREERTRKWVPERRNDMILKILGLWPDCWNSFSCFLNSDAHTHCCLWPLWPRLIQCLHRVCKDLPRTDLPNTFSHALKKQTQTNPKSGNDSNTHFLRAKLWQICSQACFSSTCFLVCCKQQHVAK